MPASPTTTAGELRKLPDLPPAILRGCSGIDGPCRLERWPATKLTCRIHRLRATGRDPLLIPQAAPVTPATCHCFPPALLPEGILGYTFHCGDKFLVHDCDPGLDNSPALPSQCLWQMYLSNRLRLGAFRKASEDRTDSNSARCKSIGERPSIEDKLRTSQEEEVTPKPPKSSRH